MICAISGRGDFLAADGAVDQFSITRPVIAGAVAALGSSGESGAARRATASR